MSSLLNSNINTINNIKNPLISESTENFYRIFKKLCNTNPLNENLLLELLNIDYQQEENFRFSVYYIMENFNKILPIYINSNNDVFKIALDKFLSNHNFKFMLEIDFLKLLLEKESSKFFDTKNFKTMILNNFHKTTNDNIYNDFQDLLISNDNQYFIKEILNNNKKITDKANNDFSSYK